MTPEELEAQLRVEAEQAIKALVEKYRQSENKTIDEIEAAALAMGKQYCARWWKRAPMTRR